MQAFTSYYSSPIGVLKIECSDNGVQSIIFLNEPLTTEAANENHLTQLTYTQLDEYFKGFRKSFALPQQQTGTDFQTKVWTLLNTIPYGKTTSYLALSKQYGDPKAIRAVAAANGKNNLAIVVPCHRVIGTNRTLTGYAGGLWRKQWLLEHEAKYYSGVQQFAF